MRALITMIAILTVGIASAQSAVSTTTTEGITLSVSGVPGSIELAISGSSNVNQNGTFQVPRRAPFFLSPLYASGSIADQAKLSGSVIGGTIIGGTVSSSEEAGIRVVLDERLASDIEIDEFIEDFSIFYRDSSNSLIQLGPDDAAIFATSATAISIELFGVDLPSGRAAFIFN